MNWRNAFFIYAGWLAIAMSVHGDIVWSGVQFQRAHHDISDLDFNLDGVNDFTFTRAEFLGGTYQEYSIVPLSGGIVVEQQPGFLNPVSLEEGTLITSTLSSTGLVWELVWEASETFLFGYGTVNDNPDYGGLYNQEGYLGVSFQVEGNVHYGWVHASHDVSRPIPVNQYLYIHGWAYESTPGAAITAGAIPEPSTGILTMVGSLSLLMLARSRRRRKQGRAPLPKCHAPKAPPTLDEW